MAPPRTNWRTFALVFAAVLLLAISALYLFDNPLSQRQVGNDNVKPSVGGTARSQWAGSNAPKVDWGMSKYPPRNSPMIDFVERLKVMAAAGDAVAACRVAAELERCDRAAAFAQLGEQQLAKSRQPDLSEDKRLELARSAEDLLAQSSEAKTICRGISSQEGREAWRYALMGAQGGHIPSMVRFARLPPPAMLSGNEDAAKAYETYAPVYLDKAVEAGSAVAYDFAAHAYLRGKIWTLPIPVDYVKALALFSALRDSASSPEREVYESNIQHAITEYKVSAPDVARSKVIAVAYSTKLREANGTKTFDFSQGYRTRFDGADCEAE